MRAQVKRNQDADTGTRHGRDAGENAQHLGKRKRDKGEVRAPQSGTEGKRTDRGADQRTASDPEREGNPGVDAIAHLQDGGDIRAGAEEGGMPEGILPAIAGEHVPALADQRDQRRYDKKIEHEVGRGEQRDRRERSDDEHNVRQRSSFHARSPNRPLGRKRSTRMNMTKMPICPSDSPR